MKENYKSNKPCVVCGLNEDGKVCYHHLLTKRVHSKLKNDPRVLIGVCLKHHQMFHNKGTSYMVDMYPSVQRFLIQNGWEYCTLTSKWRLNTLQDG